MNKAHIANLTGSRWLFFSSGLLLVVLAFLFPRDSTLYGGGASTVGIVFILLALRMEASWTAALGASVSSLLCIVGGFAYGGVKALSMTLSLLGVALAILVLGMVLRNRLTHRRA